MKAHERMHDLAACRVAGPTNQNHARAQLRSTGHSLLRLSLLFSEAQDREFKISNGVSFIDSLNPIADARPRIRDAERACGCARFPLARLGSFSCLLPGLCAQPPPSRPVVPRIARLVHLWPRVVCAAVAGKHQAALSRGCASPDSNNRLFLACCVFSRATPLPLGGPDSPVIASPAAHRLLARLVGHRRRTSTHVCALGATRICRGSVPFSIHFKAYVQLI